MFRECLFSAIIAMLVISLDGKQQCPTGMECNMQCTASPGSQGDCDKTHKEFIPPSKLCSCCGLCLAYLGKSDACPKSVEVHPVGGSKQTVKQNCKPGLKCSAGTCK